MKFQLIKNFYDTREPHEWIKDFGTPVPQDFYGALVIEVSEKERTVGIKDDIPWHHDKGYLKDVHEHVALYCVEAENAGAIQFCDMEAAFQDAPPELKVQERALNTVSKYMKAHNHAFDFKSDLEKRFYRMRSKSYHNIVQDGYFYFSEAYTVTDREQELAEHCFQDKYIFTHEYTAGDLLLYDNKRLVHRRDGTKDGKKTLLRFALNDIKTGHGV